MNITELRGKTEDELRTILTNNRKEAFNLRFQKSSGIVEKTSRIRDVRKTIARVQTLLNQTHEQRTAVAKPAKTKAEKKPAEKKAAAPKKDAAKKPAAKKKTA